MKQLLTLAALLLTLNSFSQSPELTYEIKDQGEVKVHLNADRKTFIATVTLFVGIEGDTISPPFGDGTSFIIELKWGEAIPDSIDAKSIRYINHKYNGQ